MSIAAALFITRHSSVLEDDGISTHSSHARTPKSQLPYMQERARRIHCEVFTPSPIPLVITIIKLINSIYLSLDDQYFSVS